MDFWIALVILLSGSSGFCFGWVWRDKKRDKKDVALSDPDTLT